ncbi:MAG: putative toxin-antitoxin system toxin component, PIN family [Nitrospina sp.]|nr:putative toxin-antitoxin system toxin component, PIN family [Nitrospina sp.]
MDTNVLVSAFATRGLCSDVLRETVSSHQLIISEPLLTELERILKYKIHLPETLIKESLSFITQIGLAAEPIDGPVLDIEDKDDIVLIYSALNGNTNLFVTGDKELLDLEKVDQMVIVNPRSFWELLKNQPID